MEDQRLNILIFSAGMVSGAFRRMMDIIDSMDGAKYRFFVAYKPGYADWGDDEIDMIAGSGATVVPLRGRRLFDPRGFIDLWRIITREEIAILHSWDVLGVPARIVAALAGITIVEELGNPPPARFSEISFKHYLINKATSILVDGFVACSHGVMKRYREERALFLRNTVTSVVHNSIDLSRIFLPRTPAPLLRQRYGLSAGAVVVTTIGYFNEQKAQDDLLRAFKRVTTERPDSLLCLVGWGRLDGHLKGLTRALGLEGRVIFTGRLSQDQVFEVLSVSDLFVLSSHWEGFGIVLAEAMALGKPVVSTETDGSREVVSPGETGILVPVKNPELLAEAIVTMLRQPDVMARMGAAGLRRVSRCFSREGFVAGYEAFYSALGVKRHGRGAARGRGRHDGT